VATLSISSIADAEISVRSFVDRDLAALPPSFGDPLSYRPALIRFYVADLARQLATDVLASAASDVSVVVMGTVQRMLGEELLRRVNV